MINDGIKTVLRGFVSVQVHVQFSVYLLKPSYGVCVLIRKTPRISKQLSRKACWEKADAVGSGVKMLMLMPASVLCVGGDSVYS